MKLTITITKNLTQEESDYITQLTNEELKDWIDETNMDALVALGLSEGDINTTITNK